MFGSIDKSSGLLFVTNSLDPILQAKMQSMRPEVESMDENRLLTTAPNDLKNYLVRTYDVTSIALRCDDWYADHQNVKADVHHDQMRWIDDRSRLVLTAGQRIEDASRSTKSRRPVLGLSPKTSGLEYGCTSH